jgi:hypothetical protein
MALRMLALTHEESSCGFRRNKSIDRIHARAARILFLSQAGSSLGHIPATLRASGTPPLKDITAGDTLRGCRKYEHGFSFKSIAKLWLAGNHKPAIRGTDDGIWRRVRLIPFERQFGPGERDENLRSKLLAELTGILNWLVQGAMLWQKEGLRPGNRQSCGGRISDGRRYAGRLFERSHQARAWLQRTSFGSVRALSGMVED